MTSSRLFRPRTTAARLDPLSELIEATPGLEAVALMRYDGAITSAVGPKSDELRHCASFAIGIADLAARLAEESQRGRCRLHLTVAEFGAIVLHHVDEHSTLVAIANPDVALGTLVHDLGVASAQLLEQGEQPWTP